MKLKTATRKKKTASLKKKPRSLRVIQLSDTEHKVLLWSAKGKTKKKTGKLIGLSEHTVDYHMRNVFRKLKVNNLPYAVFKAQHLGLIKFG